MRTITENDRKGLLVAFRTFIRSLNGERIPAAAGDAMLRKALDAGVSFDAILNRNNWLRAEALSPGLSAETYTDILAEHRIEVHDLSEEKGWHDIENGFAVVAEAAHDFYFRLTGKGGKWNIESALRNLAKAIDTHSLQAILSEDLIAAVTGGKDETTYFEYIEAIAKDFNSLPVDDSPTEAQERWMRLADEAIRESQSPAPEKEAEEKTETNDEKETPGNADNETGEEETIIGEEEDGEPEPPLPEDVPYPDPAEFEMRQTGGFELLKTDIYPKNNPRDIKFNAISKAIQNYSPDDIAGLARTISGSTENGSGTSLINIIIALTDGKFDPSLESPSTAMVHQMLSGDLTPEFVQCIRTQGVDMDEEVARKFDILRDSWDLRSPEQRKIHKLKRLVHTYASSVEEDYQDLLEVIRDVEKLYDKED